MRLDGEQRQTAVGRSGYERSTSDERDLLNDEMTAKGKGGSTG